MGRKDNPSYIYLLMSGTFFGSRILFWHAGVKFNTIPLSTFWQYLDVTILSGNLLEGVYYLHSQPPLFNLFLGGVLKLFPNNNNYFFHAAYLLFGFVIYCGIYHILYSKIYSQCWSFVLATIFILTPEAVLYENWLMYTWLIAAFLVAAAYAVMKYENTLDPKFALLFVLLISLLCLTRSAFHPLYLAFSIFLLVGIKSEYRRVIYFFSGTALALVGMLLLKNLLLFGFFGSSSWLGMNMWTITPKSVIHRMKADNMFYEIAKKEPFLSISGYPEKYSIVPEKYSGLQQLTNEYKVNGKRNYNHYGYIGLSRDYQELSLKIISYDFIGYLRNVFKGWMVYSKPAWQFMPLAENRMAIDSYIDLSSLLKLRLNMEKYMLGDRAEKEVPFSSYLLMPAVFLVILCGAIKKIVYKIKFKERIGVFNVFILVTILYLAVVVIFFQFGENNRMRVMSDPLIYIAVILAVNELFGLFGKSENSI